MTNESLFDGFRRARRSSRSGWSGPYRSAVSVPRSVKITSPVGDSDPGTGERITEADMQDDNGYANCGHCGNPDYRAMLYAGICQTCATRAHQDMEDTLQAITRQEYALL